MHNAINMFHAAMNSPWSAVIFIVLVVCAFITLGLVVDEYQPAERTIEDILVDCAWYGHNYDSKYGCVSNETGTILWCECGRRKAFATKKPL